MTTGYIVIWKDAAMNLGKEGYLWIGYKTATHFATRRAAKKAIERSLIEFPTDERKDYIIVRLEP